MKKKIQDFGENIGGARKDVWAARGLLCDDLMSMNSLERNKYAKKAYIWPVPNWEQLLAEGKDQALLYWQNEMRKAFSAAPYIRFSQKEDEDAVFAAQKVYVDFCAAYRKAVMDVSELSQISSFCHDFLVANGYLTENQYGPFRYSVTEKAPAYINNKMVRLATIKNLRSLKAEAATKLFAIPKDQKAYQAMKLRYQVIRYDSETVTLNPDYREHVAQIIVKVGGSSLYFYDYREVKSEDMAPGGFFVFEIPTHSVAAYCKTQEEADAYVDEKAKKASEQDHEAPRSNNRKKSFSVQKLERIQRSIPTHLDAHSGEKEFLKDLKFRACEFGNWLGDNERQKHLDLAYDSLVDLAELLGIDHGDISLNGTLALAFGSRGRGGVGAASAHYEPLRQVINLTKMNGAGCLAHEWAHGFDYFMAQQLGFSSTAFLSEKLDTLRAVPENVPKAYGDLIKMFIKRLVPLSDEEAELRKKQALERYEKAIRGCCSCYFPRYPSDEQKTEWEHRVARLIEALGEYQAHGRFQPLQDLADLIPARTQKTFIKEVVLRLNFYKAALDKPIAEYKDSCGLPSNYFAGSKEFDKHFSKAGQGYWSSIVEMFARAFDCYIEDKLKQRGQRSDYLSSHASAFFIRSDDGSEYVYAYPTGEERVAIDAKFDELFDQIKDMGIFHRAKNVCEAKISEALIVLPVKPQDTAEEHPFVSVSVLNHDSAANPNREGEAHDDATVFLNCNAIQTITPRVMSEGQQKEWKIAVLNLFEDPCQENTSALSDLRMKFIGRGIPSYNLKWITASIAKAKKEKLPATYAVNTSKPVSCHLLDECHQISFSELMLSK